MLCYVQLLGDSSMPALCIGCIVAKGWKYCCIFLERIEEILTNHNSMQTIQLFINNRDHRQPCWEFMTGTNKYVNRKFMVSPNKVVYGETGLNLKWLQILSEVFFNVNIGSDIKFWFLNQIQDIGRISGTCVVGFMWVFMSTEVNWNPINLPALW